MPSNRPVIKWRDTDEEKLSRAVRNYNRKLDRLAKTNPFLADMLPDRLSKRELKNRIMTRNDFNRIVRSAERFSKKGAEQLVTNEVGFTVTKYEKREVAYKLAAVNRRRAELMNRYSAMEIINQGKRTGRTRGEFPAQRLMELRPKKFNWARMTRQHYEEFIKTLNKQSFDRYISESNENYKKNYIKALRSVFGKSQEGLVAKVMALSADEVIERYYADQNASIDFPYDPIELELKLEVLNKVWS